MVGTTILWFRRSFLSLSVKVSIKLYNLRIRNGFSDTFLMKRRKQKQKSAAAISGGRQGSLLQPASDKEWQNPCRKFQHCQPPREWDGKYGSSRLRFYSSEWTARLTAAQAQAHALCGVLIAHCSCSRAASRNQFHKSPQFCQLSPSVMRNSLAPASCLRRIVSVESESIVVWSSQYHYTLSIRVV